MSTQTLAEFIERPDLPRPEDELVLLGNPAFVQRWPRVLKLRDERPRWWRWLHPRRSFALTCQRGQEPWFLCDEEGRMEAPELLQAGIAALHRATGRQGFVVLGKSYQPLDDAFMRSSEPHVRKVLGNNLLTRHPKAAWLPLGRDFRSHEVSRHLRPVPIAARDTLCYANFSINTHPVRESVARQARALPFVRVDHMGQWLDYPISRETFFERLAHSRFCLCPRGNGVETFRAWDCLYLGVVPVIVREAPFHDSMQDLPILWLEKPEQYGDLSEAWLEEQWQAILKTRWNYRKLRLSYWLEEAGVPSPDAP